MLRPSIGLAIGLSCATACSDGGGDQSGQDAAPADTGDDDPCQGHSIADSGTSGACNGATGGRCNVAMHETCVWSYKTDDVSCVCSFGSIALDQECRTDRPSCGPGLTCVTLTGESGPTCHQVCDLKVPDGCDRLAMADPANVYQCSSIGNGQGMFSENFGLCLVLGTACDPLDDRCDVTEHCSFLGSGTGCIPLGTPALGETCPDALCARGALCAKIGTLRPAQCYQPCNLTQSSCTTGTCRDVGYPFGLCF